MNIIRPYTDNIDCVGIAYDYTQNPYKDGSGILAIFLIIIHNN
jgi:hypothetical protein